MRSSTPKGSESLYRAEALAAQRQRLYGDVILATPPATLLLSSLCLAAVLAAGVFLSCAQYARTETVAGYLATDVGVSTLLPPRAGIVQEVRVAVGDRVRAGDVLIRVTSEASLPDGAGLEAELRRKVAAQLRELEAELGSGNSFLERLLAHRKEQIQELDAQIAQLDAKRSLTRQRWEIGAKRGESFAALREKGVISENQLQDRRSETLSLEEQLRSIDAELLARKAQQSQLRAELDLAPIEHGERQAELRVRVYELAARASELESRSSYAITAPVDGQVASLQAGVGAAVSPGLPVAVILPKGARLEANLLVPTRAAGMIEAGQRVGVKYAAFPYTKFGIQAGRVARVDAAVLAPAELRAPLQMNEPVYRVVADLDRQHVTAFGRPYPLQLGMLLEAEIVLERRSLLEWILEPLYSIRGTPEFASRS